MAETKTETASPTVTEAKPVAPAVAEAAEKVVTGMAVEDLLERWSAEETEATDEVETNEAEEGTEGGEQLEGTDENPIPESVPGERDGTKGETGSDNSDADGAKEGVSAEPDRDGTSGKRRSERAVAENTNHPVTPLPPELAEIEALIDSAEYDPFNEDTQKKIVKTLLKTVKAQQDVIESARAVTQEAANKAAEEAYWKDYTTKNPDVGQAARKLWDESLANQSKKGYRGDALVAAATTEWEFRVDQAKSAAKARAAKPAEPKASPKGTSISPKSTVSARPPQPKPKTIDEKIESGAYGDLTKIL